MSAIVRAAGGVVWRWAAGEAIEVLLVHRHGREDWTFPKGKVESGESDVDCARREVEEETSLRCELGVELPAVSYVDQRERPKTVRYWSMRPTAGEAAPRHEVDAVRWVPLASASDALTYPRDRELLDAFARLVRHASRRDSDSLREVRGDHHTTEGERA
ncbi:MAG: NUDIX hydrolase [Candidatus Rokuibacteriota bacterium]